MSPVDLEFFPSVKRLGSFSSFLLASNVLLAVHEESLKTTRWKEREGGGEGDEPHNAPVDAFDRQHGLFAALVSFGKTDRPLVARSFSLFPPPVPPLIFPSATTPACYFTRRSVPRLKHYF